MDREEKLSNNCLGTFPVFTGWGNTFQYPFLYSKNFSSYQHQSYTPHKIISELLYTHHYEEEEEKNN